MKRILLRIFVIFGMAVVVLSLIWTFWSLFQDYTLLQPRETAVTNGKIVVCNLEKLYINNTISYKCAPTVDFTTVSGKKIEFVSSYEASGFSKGDIVQVHYDPHHPQDAVITSWEFWAEYWFLGGLVLFVAGVVLVNRYRRKRSAKT